MMKDGFDDYYELAIVCCYATEFLVQNLTRREHGGFRCSNFAILEPDQMWHGGTGGFADRSITSIIRIKI